jgi:hypothetical protein
VTEDLAELARRVQRLEDLEAVRASWLDYCHCLDAGDHEALGDVFTEDADLELVGLAPSLDGAYHGRRSIIDDFYRKTEATSSAPVVGGLQTGHLSTNLQITLDGDQATTLAYFFEIVDDNLVLIGTYQHRMRRDADRWRFARLHISVRFRARIEASQLDGRSLGEILARPV